MSSRLRSLDSKISFFAFADIITAVSGVLIFIALLLATDLGQPTDSRTQSESAQSEVELRETLAQQAAVDAQNHRWQELLAMADTAPNLEKLEADIARLRSQLSEEQKKQSALADQMDSSQAAVIARDKVLGLTELKATIRRTEQETESIKREEAKARDEMSNLEQRIAHVESQILKLRQWEGQIWLIPDKSATAKEPLVVFVDHTGVTLQHVEHPEKLKWDKAAADAEFKKHLAGAKALSQYVVFEVKPSGIGLFKNLVESARGLGFDVGYDALEEDKRPNLSPFRPFDESTPATDIPAPPPARGAPSANGTAGPTASAAPAPPPPQTNQAPPTAATSTPAPLKHKSWWQRFLEWIGVK